MFRTLTIRNFPTRCMWIGLLFCTVYNSYRYPLQINSSGTSPTYSDTPVAFQIAKFAVVAILCLFSIGHIPSRLLDYKQWFLAGFLIYLSLFPILKALLSDKDSQLRYLEVAFWPLAALILSLAAGPISIDSLNRYLRFVFLYTFLSTAVQVLLFIVLGRLPALAYKGSIAVRFGGFLDDPNGFPALLYMLMGWSYYRYSGWKCFWAEFGIVLCLMLSQSFTALSYLVVLSFLFTLYHLVRGPRPIVAFSSCILVALITVPFVPRLAAFFNAVMLLKSSSIDAHVSQNATPLGSTLVDLFLGGESYVPYESWWIGSLHNFGFVWYLLNVAGVMIVVSLTSLAFFRTSDPGYKAVLAAIMMLSAYFIVANSNLPLFTVFPINFIFCCLSYLVLFRRVAGVDSAVSIVSRAREGSVAMTSLPGSAS